MACATSSTVNFQLSVITSNLSKAHVMRDSSCPATLAISVSLQQ